MGVNNIQTAGYNGARTVYQLVKLPVHRNKNASKQRNSPLCNASGCKSILELQLANSIRFKNVDISIHV